MGRATDNPSIKLWTRFRDPYLRACFKAAAEDDGLAPALAEQDNPRHLDGGGAAEVIGDTGRRVRVLEDA
jgi:hypothetical protein